jgi:protein N-terminal methyltransferase
VDLVEPVHHFLDKAQADLGSNGTARGSANSNNPKTHRAVNFYCTPLQDFTPEAGRYDVIWVQWCIGHLTDHDFIAFFKRAQVLFLDKKFHSWLYYTKWRISLIH